MSKQIEALKLALETLEADPLEMVADANGHMVFLKDKAITAIKEALAQPEQEPVAYDKTEMNCFVQDLYDKKMQERKHGHYETMFHVVHQAIKKVSPQRTWVGLTAKEKHEFRYSHMTTADFIEDIEAKLKDKNTSGQE